MAVVMKQLDRAEEAIEAIKSFRGLCPKQAQESLDNVLIDLYKKCGRVDEQIMLLKQKLRMIYIGEAFNGKPTKTARSHGKKFQVSVQQETSRILPPAGGNHPISGNLHEFHIRGSILPQMAPGKDPLIISEKDEMRNWSRRMRAQGKSIGLVPTMGYLHQGHLSLIKEAQQHAESIVVSIYVNPGQFSPNEDLSTYPRDFLGDIEKLKSVPGGVDVVFHPYNLYDYGGNDFSRDAERGTKKEGKVVSCVDDGAGVGHETWVRVESLEKGLCGKSRPVFFRGVATIVTKLFNIVDPDVAVFGKKDYQQWRIIKRMVRDLDFGIKVIGSDLVREDDGLAMSSRNVHLSPAEREKALSISRSLAEARIAAGNGNVNCKELKKSAIQAVQEAGGVIDYAEIVDQESLDAVEEIIRPVVFCIAAWFGNVRLIDNMEIQV
ncbi:OLC1v1006813C1 [Oldenlandia corymbosa var. corymbosa]|uniref:Pantoate--beta-alanine ligase n=1 Tax=Oldenlandia corymbosa var. corymbosa TaxID=529605 RepID=A0AAV1DKB6_OLDCO|nr:OLC1v1006813C1 [Oldenlandia corymbosa var. corymbosa]